MDIRNFNFDPNDPSARYLYSLFSKMKANIDMPIIDGFRNPFYFQKNNANQGFPQMNGNNNFPQKNNNNNFPQMNNNNNFPQMNNFRNNNNMNNINANNLNYKNI